MPAEKRHEDKQAMLLHTSITPEASNCMQMNARQEGGFTLLPGLSHPEHLPAPCMAAAARMRGRCLPSRRLRQLRTPEGSLLIGGMWLGWVQYTTA